MLLKKELIVFTFSYFKIGFPPIYSVRHDKLFETDI